MIGDRRRWVFSDKEQDKWLSGPFAIICDRSWYEANRSDVVEWLDLCAPGWALNGTVIDFADADHLTMFKLRWA